MTPKRDDTAYDEPDADPDTPPTDPANPGLYRPPGYTDPYGLTLPPQAPPEPAPIIAWVQLSPNGTRQSLHFIKPRFTPPGWTTRALTYHPDHSPHPETTT